MKKLLLSLLLIPLVCQSAVVNFYFTNFSATTPTNGILQIIPTNGPIVNHPWLIIGHPVRVRMTNGFASTNILTGNYLLGVPPFMWSRPLMFSVPDSTNSYNITELLATGFSANITNTPFVSQVVAGTGIAVSPTSGRGVVTVTANDIPMSEVVNLPTSLTYLSNSITSGSVTNIDAGFGITIAGTTISADTNVLATQEWVSVGLGNYYNAPTPTTNVATAEDLITVVNSAASGTVVGILPGTYLLHTNNLVPGEGVSVVGAG